MAVPASRSEFKEYCLRKLGKPVIEINVDDDQVEDRIDEALKYYWDYHFDGSEKLYYKHLITSTDITNKYITLPENIIGVVKLFPVGQSLNTMNLFNLRYQIALNDLYTLTTQSMVPYVMAMQHIQFLEEILVGQKPVRYSRHKDRLYIDMDWGLAVEGEYFVVEAYEVIDPDTFTDVWGDRWLALYATALIKYQWGSNLTKFTGMVLPGGVQFNGEKIQDDAKAEVEALEQEMQTSYTLPAYHMVG
jgi:hypothetical protein